MKILYGIADGALLQRDAEGCRCFLVLETQGVPSVSLGKLTRLDGNRFLLTEIPTGGPYRLTFMDDVSQVKIENLWVGDLWVLAGQSNMDGNARERQTEISEGDNSPEYLRCFHEDNRWDKVRPVNHEPWLSVEECQYKPWREAHKDTIDESGKPFVWQGKPLPRIGVGPGYYFIKKMYEFTGVPQGIIACAMGGSWLELWEPCGEEENNLYAQMLRRFIRCGGAVRGVYWDQGEAETNEQCAEKFVPRMQRLVTSIRRDFGNKKLPFVQTQLANCSIPSYCDEGDAWKWWTAIREKQRTMYEFIDDLDTVSAIDADYDDPIHYSTDTQKTMGARAAVSMAHLCGYGGKPAPKFSHFSFRKDEYVPQWCVLDVYFENAEGLHSIGRPSGFTVIRDGNTDIRNPFSNIARLEVLGDRVSIHLGETEEIVREWEVYYAFGHMNYCNIVDGLGRALPAFGGLKIKDYLK